MRQVFLSAILVCTAMLTMTGCSTADGTPDGVISDVAGDTAPDTAQDTAQDDVDDAIADADVVSDVPPDGLVKVQFVPPACGTPSTEWRGLITGPGDGGYDAELETKATRYEKSWQVFTVAGIDLNKDITINLENTADRTAVEDFIQNSNSWDFKAHSGKEPLEVISFNHKVAGLYAGVGIAANAYRYGVLRNQGYPCDEVERARGFLLASLDAMHIATDITGKPGIIARGLMRTDIPGEGDIATTPLFDDQGVPLPYDKSNGTWRDDFSGRYPNYKWEDSVSRDMYIGWVTAMAAAWEVIHDDDSVPQTYKDTLKADALAIAKELMVVRISGYDLEIPDADGRTTLHGWLNPQNFDGQFYMPGLENGFHAVMALGIVAAFVYITEDPDLTAWLNDDLIKTREFPRIINEHGFEMVDMGTKSNYSNYNMAFAGLWLCLRYLDNLDARKILEDAVGKQFYSRPDQPRQASEIGYSYYDFIYAAGAAGGHAWGRMAKEPDSAAVEQGINTLKVLSEAPYWDYAGINCPDAVCTEEEPEVTVPDCYPEEGVHLHVLGCVGRNADMITEEPVPMNLIGPSNYQWRSNPYRPNNDGNGANLLPGVDFRIAYWIGRWARR